ncbi:MAG: 16S rRNA (cytosine(1402)-N(4))-methyltransferase RsmH [Dehalococcoidales bacterium]|nr:16S rRNA (cytosine(1402)-N(4))-methyltransferase RsmH [Dehalococcoidales bacterium]
MTSTHLPVLVKEVIQGLAVRPGGRYIDCTVGGGGHAVAILEHSSPGGQLLGLDADPEAVSITRGRLETYRDAVLIVNENFVRLRSVCEEYDFYPVHGILFDLGLSSLQLASNARGFSFQRESALDMRLSPEQETTAEDIVNTLTEDELANLLWTYGEEARSHRIARRIVAERPIRTTFQLARIIELAVGGRRSRIHPATKTFQTLRIAVNQELQNLESVLEQTVGLLGFEGRLAVISYHSLEDRIVKRFMQKESRDCICPSGIPMCVCGHTASLRMVNRKVIKPSPDEVRLNPRSRSARLRVAERLAAREENQ